MINLDKIREKFEKLNKKSGFNSESFLILKEGTTVIRILPYRSPERSTDDNFYYDFKAHTVSEDFKDPNSKFICLRSIDQDCPICSFYKSLWSTKSEADEALARKIKPVDRFYMNVLVRNTPGEEGIEKVKILSCGKMLMNKVFGIILDQDYITVEGQESYSILDLHKGRDFKIVMTKEKNWPRFDQSMPRPNTSPVAKSEGELEAVLSQLHNLPSLVKVKDLKDYQLAVENLNATRALAGAKAESSNESEDLTTEEYLENLKGDDK